MIIDSHQHFWRFNAQRDAWITDDMSILRRDFLPENLVFELRANQVDGSIAVQADQSEQETLFLLELAESNPEVVGVVGWVDLRASNLEDRLRYFSKFPKLRGFRHIVQAEPDDNFMLRSDFCRGIAALSHFDFTYDILIYPRQLSAAIELVRKFPAQRFVIDHMAKPSVRTGEIEPWARQIREISASQNLWCKLSGLMTEAKWGNWNPEQFQPYFDVVLNSLGPDRVMFGSDWPVCLLSGSYEQGKKLVAKAIVGFTPQQQKNIFGLNAISFYKIPVSDNGPAAQR